SRTLRRWSCCSLFFFSSRRRHTRLVSDWSSDVCSSDLQVALADARDPVTAKARTLGIAAIGQRHLGKPVVGIDRNEAGAGVAHRSEERRVGKEGRTRWGPERLEKKNRKRKEA